MVTRTVVQVEASISRMAESELCRKSLPFELLVHFIVHIDDTAQEIISASVTKTPSLSTDELFG